RIYKPGSGLNLADHSLEQHPCAIGQQCCPATNQQCFSTCLVPVLLDKTRLACAHSNKGQSSEQGTPQEGIGNKVTCQPVAQIGQQGNQSHQAKGAKGGKTAFQRIVILQGHAVFFLQHHIDPALIVSSDHFHHLFEQFPVKTL